MVKGLEWIANYPRAKSWVLTKDGLLGKDHQGPENTVKQLAWMTDLFHDDIFEFILRTISSLDCIVPKEIV